MQVSPGGHPIGQPAFTQEVVKGRRSAVNVIGNVTYHAYTKIERWWCPLFTATSYKRHDQKKRKPVIPASSNAPCPSGRNGVSVAPPAVHHTECAPVKLCIQVPQELKLVAPYLMRTFVLDCPRVHKSTHARTTNGCQALGPAVARLVSHIMQELAID